MNGLEWFQALVNDRDQANDMTTSTFLTGVEDMTWVKEVHGIDTDGFSCAILNGNEDRPDSVQLFEYNHIHAPQTVYESYGEGYRKVSGRTIHEVERGSGHGIAREGTEFGTVETGENVWEGVES